MNLSSSTPPGHAVHGNPRRFCHLEQTLSCSILRCVMEPAFSEGERTSSESGSEHKWKIIGTNHTHPGFSKYF